MGCWNAKETEVVSAKHFKLKLRPSETPQKFPIVMRRSEHRGTDGHPASERMLSIFGISCRGITAPVSGELLASNTFSFTRDFLPWSARAPSPCTEHWISGSALKVFRWFPSRKPSHSSQPLGTFRICRRFGALDLETHKGDCLSSVWKRGPWHYVSEPVVKYALNGSQVQEILPSPRAITGNGTNT